MNDMSISLIEDNPDDQVSPPGSLGHNILNPSPRPAAPKPGDARAVAVTTVSARGISVRSWPSSPATTTDISRIRACSSTLR